MGKRKRKDTIGMGKRQQQTEEEEKNIVCVQARRPAAGGRALCGLHRGGVSFGRVLRFRRRAAVWGAFTFGFVGVRGRKATRPPAAVLCARTRRRPKKL